jgi:hypothetical protein
MLPKGYVVKTVDETPTLQAFYESLHDFSSMPVNELFQPSIEITPPKETNHVAASPVESPKPLSEFEKIELRSINESTGFNRVVKEGTTGNVVRIENGSN